MDISPRNNLRRMVTTLICATFILASTCLSNQTPAATIEAPILSIHGDLPIIITAPHGGQETIPGVQVRTKGKILRDADTLQLAETLTKKISESLGGQPYLVAAKFSRKYIDANRAETEAFESPEARPIYLAYHRQICDFISEIKKKFPNGALLIDIHGQSKTPGIIYRGTRNGATVTGLVKRHGEAAVSGKKAIFGYLQDKGYHVFPPISQANTVTREKIFTGGYTVIAYGSNNADGIDAIQIEIAKDIRSNEKFADDLATAIVVFYKTYIRVTD